MEKTISLIANICTIMGFFIAIVGLFFLFSDRNRRLESETRKAFLAKKSWTNEGDIRTNDSIFFSLDLIESNSHRFYGEISTTNYPEKLTFYFNKSFGRSFTIHIHKKFGWRDVDLAIAKLTMISPDFFSINFTKGFEDDNGKPDFPFKTKIW
ncbi:hypothetical protein [uncultured Acinetobacter sp.]|uniref:hypothetical protein n=1 Tax=uncultured Acinetobacter sp. TaxID=165433 RepID=UPI002588E9BA|nr:hypothetical protein [uncultured Acinetobacter sp.]